MRSNFSASEPQVKIKVTSFADSIGSADVTISDADTETLKVHFGYLDSMTVAEMERAALRQAVAQYEHKLGLLKSELSDREARA